MLFGLRLHSPLRPVVYRITSSSPYHCCAYLSMSAPRKSASVHPGGKDASGTGDAVPSLSASLMILAPLQTRTEDGFDYRVLLLKRHQRSSTFVSAHVFPGGNMDPVDGDLSAWSEFLPKNILTSSPEAEKDVTLRLCAVRETFEESGLLLMEGKGKGKERWDAIPEKEKLVWRDKVHNSGTSFLDLFKLLSDNDDDKTRPGITSLQNRANWITPKAIKRRFDTHFYITILPPTVAQNSRTAPNTKEASGATGSEDPVTSSDGSETISADWLTPSAALERTMRHTLAEQNGTAPDSDAIILFPPQFYLLAELVALKSWRELLSSETDAAGNQIVKGRKVFGFEPEIKPVQDSSGQERAATVLFGDPEHSQTSASDAEAFPNRRHRTYVLVPGGRRKNPQAKTKAPPGLTVMGLHREGMGELLGEGWSSTILAGDYGASSDTKSKL